MKITKEFGFFGPFEAQQNSSIFSEFFETSWEPII